MELKNDGQFKVGLYNMDLVDFNGHEERYDGYFFRWNNIYALSKDCTWISFPYTKETIGRLVHLSWVQFPKQFIEFFQLF